MQRCRDADVAPCGDIKAAAVVHARGVTIHWLIQFTEQYECWTWPTSKVVREIIQPATISSRGRYTDLLENDSGNAPVLGPADTFVSHCWGAPWGDLVGAVSDGFASRDRRVWIDCFAVRQWPGNQADLCFASVIPKCTSFVLVCTSLKQVAELPYFVAKTKNPQALDVEVRKKIAFFRIWCLVEIAVAATLAEEGKISIVMKGGTLAPHNPRLTIPASQFAKKKTRGKRIVSTIDFCTSSGDESSYYFRHDAKMLANMIYFIDVRNAEATRKKDVEEQMAWIRSHNKNLKHDVDGIDSLNASVLRVLKNAKVCAGHSSGGLLQSAACGDRDAMGKLKDLSLEDQTAGLRACSHAGYTGVVRLLLDSGCPVNATNANHVTALMRAACCGHKDIAGLLIERGADIFMTGPSNKMAVDMCDKRHDACLDLLRTAFIRRCMKVGLPKEGMTSNPRINLDREMFVSAAEDHPHALLACLDHGASLTAFDKYNRSVLKVAHEKGHAQCVSIIQTRWRAAWDLRVRSASKEDASDLLVWASSQGDVEIVDMLLAGGADGAPRRSRYLFIDNRRQDKARMTSAAMAASYHGHAGVLRALGPKYAESSVRGITQQQSIWRPILIASSRGHADCIKVLLDFNVDAVSGGGNKMRGPLGYAVDGRHTECVRILASISPLEVVAKYVVDMKLSHRFHPSSNIKGGLPSTLKTRTRSSSVQSKGKETLPAQSSKRGGDRREKREVSEKEEKESEKEEREKTELMIMEVLLEVLFNKKKQSSSDNGFAEDIAGIVSYVRERFQVKKERARRYAQSCHRVEEEPDDVSALIFEQFVAKMANESIKCDGLPLPPKEVVHNCTPPAVPRSN
jgi:ankyrin repeat protein